MESALHGVYALVFVSEIPLIRFLIRQQLVRKYRIEYFMGSTIVCPLFRDWCSPGYFLAGGAATRSERSSRSQKSQDFNLTCSQSSLGSAAEKQQHSPTNPASYPGFSRVSRHVTWVRGTSFPKIINTGYCMLHCDEKKLRIDPFGELNSLQKKNVQSAVRGLNSQK